MALPDAALTASLETDEQCVAYLEELRWPGGIACPSCGHQKISRFQAKGKSGKSRQICQCLNRDCKYQFSATTGTIFHDSHLPLAKWFEAMRLLAAPAAETSVNQLRFVLGVQYKTAKNVAERIQRALQAGTIEIPAGQEAARPKAVAAVAPSPAPRVAQTPASPRPAAVAPTPAKSTAIPAAAKAVHPRAIRPVKPAPVPPQPPSATPVNPPVTPTVVDSMLSVFTSSMNLSVKPPLAAVNFLKKKILD